MYVTKGLGVIFICFILYNLVSFIMNMMNKNYVMGIILLILGIGMIYGMLKLFKILDNVLGATVQPVKKYIPQLGAPY